MLRYYDQGKYGVIYVNVSKTPLEIIRAYGNLTQLSLVVDVTLRNQQNLWKPQLNYHNYGWHTKISTEPLTILWLPLETKIYLSFHCCNSNIPILMSSGASVLPLETGRIDCSFSLNKGVCGERRGLDMIFFY